MVKAILDGRKTQTRRIIKPQPAPSEEVVFDPDCAGCVYFDDESNRIIKPKYRIGDRLWVRETWLCAVVAGEFKGIGYKASWDNADWFREIDTDTTGGKWYETWDKYRDNWRPSIFMPRWASRITLEIVNVRVERISDISNRDAIAEGVERISRPQYSDYWFRNYGKPAYINGGAEEVHYFEARDSFASLWESINGEKSWDAHPWVWVIEFKRV
jgi:hypothetical protein